MPTKQQTCAPPCYPARANTGDATDWSQGDYTPNEFEAPILSSDPLPVWADKKDCKAIDVGERLTYSDNGTRSAVKDVCVLDELSKRWRNPMGKTGIIGRGLLGRWGPNHAADCIVTRIHPETQKAQAVVIDRVDGDGTSVAWPGGMVDPGDDVPKTLRNEFIQEAAEDSSYVDRLFNECREGIVYRGCVDDHRNTDDAWMETTAVHFHATPEIAAGLKLAVKDTDEVARVAWKDIDSIDAMYASHHDWLVKVRDEMLPRITAKRRFLTLVETNPQAEWAIAYKEATHPWTGLPVESLDQAAKKQRVA